MIKQQPPGISLAAGRCVAKGLLAASNRMLLVIHEAPALAQWQDFTAQLKKVLVGSPSLRLIIPDLAWFRKLSRVQAGWQLDGRS